MRVELRNSDLDFICGVSRSMENYKSEQSAKNLIHRTPPLLSPANLSLIENPKPVVSPSAKLRINSDEPSKIQNYFIPTSLCTSLRIDRSAT